MLFGITVTFVNCEFQRLSIDQEWQPRGYGVPYHGPLQEKLLLHLVLHSDAPNDRHIALKCPHLPHLWYFPPQFSDELIQRLTLSLQTELCSCRSCSCTGQKLLNFPSLLYFWSAEDGQNDARVSPPHCPWNNYALALSLRPEAWHKHLNCLIYLGPSREQLKLKLSGRDTWYVTILSPHGGWHCLSCLLLPMLTCRQG